MVMIYAWAALAAVIGIGVYFYLRKRNEAPKDETPQKESAQEIPGGEIERYDTAPVKDGEAVYWYENGEKKEGTVKVMPQGLQVFDANGNTVVDVTTRLTKYLGTIDTGTSGGSIVNNALLDGDLWMIDIEKTLYYDQSSSVLTWNMVEFTKSGNTLSWAFPNNGRYKICKKVMYGIY